MILSTACSASSILTHRLLAPGLLRVLDHRRVESGHADDGSVHHRDPRPRSAPSIITHRMLAPGLLRVLDHRRVE